MRKNKIVVISSCEQCPFYDYDDTFHVHKWGRHWCNKLDIDLGSNVDIIPEVCPLPDENGQENERNN